MVYTRYSIYFEHSVQRKQFENVWEPLSNSYHSIAVNITLYTVFPFDILWGKVSSSTSQSSSNHSCYQLSGANLLWQLHCKPSHSALPQGLHQEEHSDCTEGK